jgi:hypothetical protein
MAMRKIAKLGMDKECGRQILTTNLDMKKVCAEMMPNRGISGAETDNSDRTSFLISLSGSVRLLSIPSLKKKLLKGTHFRTMEEVQQRVHHTH